MFECTNAWKYFGYHPTFISMLKMPYPVLRKVKTHLTWSFSDTGEKITYSQIHLWKSHRKSHCWSPSCYLSASLENLVLLPGLQEVSVYSTKWDNWLASCKKMLSLNPRITFSWYNARPIEPGNWNQPTELKIPISYPQSLTACAYQVKWQVDLPKILTESENINCKTCNFIYHQEILNAAN